MSVTIGPVSPASRDARALLEASRDLMRRLFPSDENHFLDDGALLSPDIAFFGAEESGALLGCVAIKRHRDFAELKSLFVAPEARGLGLGQRLLAHAERVAAENGLAVIRLETGDRLMAATALYERQGYVRRGPFGSYVANGSSLFFEKPLTCEPRAGA